MSRGRSLSILGVVEKWAGLVLLKIEKRFPPIISRSASLRMTKLYMWIEVIERKVPIDFERDRKVGGACVTKNRKTVSADYLEIRFTYNGETLYVDRDY